MKIPDLTLHLSGSKISAPGSQKVHQPSKADLTRTAEGDMQSGSRSSLVVKDQLELSSHSYLESDKPNQVSEELNPALLKLDVNFESLVYRLAQSIKKPSPTETPEKPDNPQKTNPESEGSIQHVNESSVLSRIEKFLEENNLNPYGDPVGTIYTGGTPLLDESTGKAINRLEYLLSKFPELTIA